MLASSSASLVRQRSSMPLRSAAPITARWPGLRASRMPHSSNASRTPATRNLSSSAEILSAPPQRARRRGSPSASSSLPPGKTSAPEKASICVMAHHHEHFEQARPRRPAWTGAPAGQSSPAADRRRLFLGSFGHATIVTYLMEQCHASGVHCGLRRSAVKGQTHDAPLTIPARTASARASARCVADGAGSSAFGVISLIAGLIALGSVVMSRPPSAVYIVGFMMLLAGAAEIVAAFNAKDWGHRIAVAAARRALCLRRLHLPAEPVRGGDHPDPDAGHRADHRRARAHLPRDAHEAGHAVGLGGVLRPDQRPARPRSSSRTGRSRASSCSASSSAST